MTTITLTKDENGRPVGLGEKDKKAYAKFRKALEALQSGEIYTLDYWFPRNPKLHGLHFVMIGAIFDQQGQFEDPDSFRKWLYVGAGYADFYPGPKGRMVAIAKSINWRAIDDADFGDIHDKAIAFARSPHATNFLWPHLTPEQQSEMITKVLEDFDGV
jgi:hypothetical protein